MKCIDLKAAFPNLRITHDPAAATAKEKRDPWTYQLVCRYGTVWPYGGSRLAVDVDGHPAVANQLGRLPGMRCVQDGDAEKSFTFDISRHPEVFAVIRPLRKRGRKGGTKATAKQQTAGTANLTKSRRRRERATASLK